MAQTKTLFTLGRLLMTSGVSEKMARDSKFAAFMKSSLARHAAGDWGDMSPEDSG